MNCLVDLIAKLQKLNCPFISGDAKTHWWLQEMLFEPGKPRVEFMKWLLISLGNNCSLDSNADIETLTKNLTKVAVTNGFCSSKEEDLIRGLATKERQATFISFLLDLAFQKLIELDSTLFDLTLNPLDVTLTDKCVPSMLVSPRLLTVWNCMTKIIANGHFAKSVNAKINTNLPIGLQKELERRKSDRSIDRQVGTKLTELREEAQTLQMRLNELPNITAVTEDQNLKLNQLMNELEAASSRFVKLYDDELKFWCRTNGPTLSSLGTLSEKIELKVAKLVQVTQDVDRLRYFYVEEIPKFRSQVSNIDKRLNSTVTHDNLGSDLCHGLDTFTTIVEKWTDIREEEEANSDDDDDKLLGISLS